MHTFTRARTHTHTHTHTYTRMHTHTHTRTHARTHTHTHVRARTHARTNARTNERTHAHTLSRFGRAEVERFRTKHAVFAVLSARNYLTPEFCNFRPCNQLNSSLTDQNSDVITRYHGNAIFGVDRICSSSCRHGYDSVVWQSFLAFYTEN